jgi:hypothetical protein
VAFEVKEEAVVFPEGIDVYEAYYVASTGSDTAGTGTRAKPFATVKKAQDEIAAAYGADASWPGKGNLDTAAYATIVILNTVPVSIQIDIDNSASIYPPILLTDGSLSFGGTLQATRAIGHENNLLKLQNGARVTLAGGLVLAGLGTDSDKDHRLRGVYVDGSASVFTMAGGEISGHFAKYRGGGVFVDGGTFILSGGEVTGNKTSGGGGGVYVKSGTFILSDDGAVRGNAAVGDVDGGNNGTYGGGVWITAGTFTMTGGEISGNDVGLGNGGGVYVDYTIPKTTGAFATFTMEGGTISGNTAGGWGGGVVVGGVFTMSAGTITGNTTTMFGGGGVVVQDTDYSGATMTGGTVKDNNAAFAPEVLLGNPGTSVTTPAIFTMSGNAQPTRVFLADRSPHSITIGGTLNGSWKTVIDLGLDSNKTITSWVGTQILTNPGTQSSRFSLGQTVDAHSSPPKVVDSSLTAYAINSSGILIK